MPDKNISIGQSFKFGWISFKSNVGYFIKIFAVIFVFYVALTTASYYTDLDANILPGILVNLISYAFQIVISIGLVKISIIFVRDSKPLVSDLFSSYRLFFKYLFSSILYNLITMVGLILFVIPGIIWSLKFSQFQYLVVDKKRGPIQALKESSRLTKGAKWELLGFFIVAFLVNVLGVLAFFVGIFVTIPITMLAYAHVYQQLLDQDKPTVDTKTPVSPNLNPPASPPNQNVVVA
jgi:uncharacterized membrane protein